MNKCYLFAYSDKVGTREQVKIWLDQIPEITDWRYELPNTYYLISENSAKELSEKFTQISGNRANMMFIITEIGANSYGWLAKESWHLIQNKKRLQ